jgi:hypothetical protein
MAQDQDFRDYEDRPRQDIPNYLVQSILVTVCCCLIGGIIAIVNAAQVNGKLAAGDIAGARKASDQAKMWCWISFGVGIVTNAIVVAIQIVAATASTKAGLK